MKLSVFLLLEIFIVVSASTSPVEDLLEWVDKADGGFVHTATKNLQDGKYVIVSEPIKAGEIILQVPSSHILKTDQPPKNDLDCLLIDHLANQRALGENSFYAPLIKYLKYFGDSQPPIPSVWSTDGMKLIRRVSHEIPPIEPIEWIRKDFFRSCKGSKENVDLALQTIQWGVDGVIVPILDGGMYQHRNGNWTNADAALLPDDGGIQVFAIRDIQAGEAIYISQNQCARCEPRSEGYGTAELFRDYGIIENFPQRWHFYDVAIQFDLDKNLTHYILDWSVPYDPENPDDQGKEGKVYMALRKQVRRLLYLQHMTYKGVTPEMPQSEWEIAWKFSKANILAMMIGAQALEDGNVAWPISDFAVETMTHYAPLAFEYDDTNYQLATCDVEKILELPGHRHVELIETPYQNLLFDINPHSEDVLMTLDTIIQSGSSFRPHYHEYMIHMSARFVKKVQRVVIIGGGDSMLLHEALKYPDLELVVGLELDQYVPRKCFKYFSTQPHFDDPRVEWWFGDATKSLLLLPEDYWHSFDLVLVDLSETVMSLSVTTELDVFDALSLLLKPEGVLAKNEEYMEKISTVFDYSIQSNIKMPVFCDETMTLGSNNVDFLHAPLYDHQISNIVYEPLHTYENRLDFLHDYRRNNATAQGKCNLALDLECDNDQKGTKRSAGIVQIIDAENVQIPLDESISAVLKYNLEKHGYTSIKTPITVGTFIILFFDEGYLLARMWPEKKYVSMDVNVWGRFKSLKGLVSDLKVSMEAPVFSKLRVVVGGMFGSATTEEDSGIIGPQMTQMRNCEPPVFSNQKEGAPSSQDFLDEAFLETLKTIVTTTETVAVVLCGEDSKNCNVVDVLNRSTKVKDVIRLSACSNLDSVEKMYECESIIAKKWQADLFGEKMELLVVDESAPKEFLQVIDSLLSHERYRKAIQAETNVAIAWSANPRKQTWRKYFLENYRRHYMHDFVSRAEIWMHANDYEAELGVVSCGNDNAAYSFRDAEANLRDRFDQAASGAFDISLEVLWGGIYSWLDVFALKEYSQSDYDSSPGLSQYYSQEPLAHHVIFQLEADDSQDIDFSKSWLSETLQVALKSVAFDCEFEEAFEELGDGLVLACLNSKLGSVLLLWDGRSHVDISYYRIGSDEESRYADFASSFVTASKDMLQVALRDDMPRGVGRVINPESDLQTPEERAEVMEELKRLPPEDVFFDELEA